MGLIEGPAVLGGPRFGLIESGPKLHWSWTSPRPGELGLLITLIGRTRIRVPSCCYISNTAVAIL